MISPFPGGGIATFYTLGNKLRKLLGMDILAKAVFTAHGFVILTLVSVPLLLEPIYTMWPLFKTRA